MQPKPWTLFPSHTLPPPQRRPRDGRKHTHRREHNILKVTLEGCAINPERE